MRVDLRTHGTEQAEHSTTERARTGSASGNTTSDAQPLDQTRFSFDQTRIHQFQRQALAQPEIRQEKVDSLRQALGKGDYVVSNSQVADAIVADFSNGSALQLSG